MFSVNNVTLVFSYWLFAWYLLYEAKWTTYNPKFGLLCGLLENVVISLPMMLYYKNKAFYIAAYIAINAIIKVLPLWRLRKTEITEEDIGITFLLFLLYSMWLQWNDTSVEEYLVQVGNRVKQNKPATPLVSYLANLTKN